MQKVIFACTGSGEARGLPRDVLTVILTGDAAGVDAAQAEQLFDRSAPFVTCLQRS